MKSRNNEERIRLLSFLLMPCFISIFPKLKDVLIVYLPFPVQCQAVSHGSHCDNTSVDLLHMHLKLVVILFNVLHISLFYLPMTRILARELEHLICDQAPEAWILACKILIHLWILLPQKVFLGYNLGMFYNYINQIFYVLYILIIIWTYLRFQQFEISFIKTPSHQRGKLFAFCL